MSNAEVAARGEVSPVAALVSRLAAGDRAAEQDFVGHYARGVRALVRRHCRPNEPMVDDLVQDVMQSVLLHLRAGQLRDAQALPGYLRQAVVFTVAAEYRKRSRRGEDGAPSGAEAADAVDVADPQRHAEQEQIARRVSGLLNEMSVPRDREVLRRFYLEEQDKDVVCAALEIDPSHFHRVLFRARQRLRELIEAAGLNVG
jgi:RNA polymerase sigma-70 factor (ECF subfamily)